ncbi:uncharacterized protein LOC129927335 [Biomphalaria glabrata]|uniref:Uncharacterized protein LOC129927335 n=1 Tax=Biomphalaria glabrata TaxID=6526 RepID=A0A9W3AXA5_BIOGL|nr:uncharacterized protein LOC129927335 [Biomphalaria glabrata]KAI8763344.1 adenosine receptor A1-like [Biomphalaria glabrata]
MTTNITVSPVLVSIPRYDGLMSSEATTLTTLILNYINLSVAAIGVATNVINVLVFTRAGPGVNATSTSFLALSLSDLCFLLLVSVFIVLRILNKLIQTPGIPLTYLSFTVVTYWHYAYNTSVLITTYTAVQKACCVAIPLTFKNIFTVKRTIWILILIVFGLLAFYLPLMSTMSITQTVVSGTNKTVYIFSYAPKSITSTFDMTLQNILPTLTLAVVMLCLMVLVVKLRQASTLRKSMTATEEDEEVGKGKSKDGSAFNAREIKVIQAVSAVSLMFVVCNLPPILVTYATFIEPEFNDYRYYGNLYSVVGSARITLQIICATVNIFVYYYFNSGYRASLLASFCINKSRG